MSPLAFVVIFLANAGDVCVKNNTDGLIRLQAQQLSDDEARIELFRRDVVVGAEVCFSIAWSGAKPITTTVSRYSDTSENPHYQSHCPAVFPGESGRFVVAVLRGALVCRRSE